MLVHIPIVIESTDDDNSRVAHEKNHQQDIKVDARVNFLDHDPVYAKTYLLWN